MVVFVYQGYRDTIHKFHGKFDTLEEAENHIYEDLVKEVQDFLDKMQQKRNGTYVSPLTQMFKNNKEGKIERDGLESYEKTLSELEERDNEITEDALRNEKYYQNRDWKGEFRKVSQTPKGSVLSEGSWAYEPNGKPPMYQGYSQRYQDGRGNYPYIIFDPSFVPTKTEMKAEGKEYSMLGGIREEFKDAESNLSEATLKRLRKTYDNYEDRNEHMSNYMLLATFFGTDADKEEVKKIMARRNRRGYLTQKENTWLYENINPYYDHLRNVKAAETFDVEFNEWADQEMLTHGKDVSFKDWAKEEGEKHGDMDLTDWAEEEEESHDERYGAETFGADKGIVEKYKHGIEIRGFPNSSSVYQKGRLVKQYRGDGHRIRATSKAQQLEWDYKPKSFFSESKSKKTKYGMIAAGVITAFALLPEIKKRF